MTTTTHRSVLIVGAGPVGLSLACALAMQGLDVDIVERQPAAALAEPRFDGREIALSHGSMHLLKRLGIWDRIPSAEIHPLRRARVSDGAHDGFEIEPTSFDKDLLGNFVSNHVIRAAAWQATQSIPAIRVHADADVQAVVRENGTVVVGLADGRRLSALLVAAADSRFSLRRLLGVPVAMHDFGKTTLVLPPAPRHTTRACSP